MNKNTWNLCKIYGCKAMTPLKILGPSISKKLESVFGRSEAVLEFRCHLWPPRWPETSFFWREFSFRVKAVPASTGRVLLAVDAQ
jgi:hypothetical protein